MQTLEEGSPRIDVAEAEEVDGEGANDERDSRPGWLAPRRQSMIVGASGHAFPVLLARIEPRTARVALQLGIRLWDDQSRRCSAGTCAAGRSTVGHVGASWSMGLS